MVMIKDLGDGNYQTYPITDDMIEVDDLEAWVEEHMSQAKKNKRRIWDLKDQLARTDYQAIKYAEGQISEEEYLPIKLQRQAWRDEINELESTLN